jgi:hypothetical protein
MLVPLDLQSLKKVCMINRKREYLSIAWAWAAGWTLVSIGQVISDVYSIPDTDLTAYYALGFVGWTIGAAGTIRYLHNRFEANVHVIALSVLGWGVGALVAVGLMPFMALWAETRQLGFLGPILSPVLGGAIGGASTLPMRSLSCPATIARASMLGAFSWGTAFLVFQFLAFYAGYILMLMTLNTLAPIVGWIWAGVPGWSLPAGVGGFLAAWLASRSLHLTERAAV